LRAFRSSSATASEEAGFCPVIRLPSLHAKDAQLSFLE
jgi:hypothetical protein